MPETQARDWSSDRTYHAAGLFVLMLGAIERGEFTKARRTRGELASLGYVVSFQPEGRPRTARKAVAQ